MSECCVDHTITIGLSDYSLPPLYTFNAAARTFSGYLPDLIEDMSHVMGFKYDFRAGSTLGARSRSCPG